jgi:putative DNA methylase
MMQTNKPRLIEADSFPFEFLSQIGERESWRKEIHRPIYHIHKWWAKRLGSVFRGILLGSVLTDGDLQDAFYARHNFEGITVFDPFMGSGTTVGEAHKLGFTAFGRDINPVAVNAVRVALGPMDRTKLKNALSDLSLTVGERIRALYRSYDSTGRECQVLYYFWVMRAPCSECERTVDLFSSYVIASNAYPNRKPQVQIFCPSCGHVFPGMHGDRLVSCTSCRHRFDPRAGSAKGTKATCSCGHTFTILDAIKRIRPEFRLYAKLVLTEENRKEYLPVTEMDHAAYTACSRQVEKELRDGTLSLPMLTLEDGYNTRQAMSYGFLSWRDFFNDRQLLALGYLRNAICGIEDVPTREALLTLFSGLLEFNNMFTSYKGEGTGAVRHMFAHHILKPERVPIEANVWGTPKSSGSFSGLFRSRLIRAFEYRYAPKEVNGKSANGIVCAPPFTGEVVRWPTTGMPLSRVISLSCGDSANSGLPDKSIDLVVTDPPFFDNVHYSELADFFYAWQEIGKRNGRSTRSTSEVQDTDSARFARKLRAVFLECHRVLKDDGMLVFTYHHSRDEGWTALTEAIIESGFVAVNSQPVKSEMSVATPKAQTKEPIQLDIVLVCKKNFGQAPVDMPSAIQSGWNKLRRLEQTGLRLSQKDKRVVLQGQIMTTLRSMQEQQRALGTLNDVFKDVVSAR